MGLTCPDWAALAGRRRHPGFEGTAEWRGALAHLADCPDCRREAAARDPLLIFGGCRDLEIGPGEIADLRRATHDLRRLRALEAAARHSPTRRAAIVASLAVAGVLILSGAPDRPTLEGPAIERTLAPAAAAPPWIENLDRPEARIYQWGSPEVAVVFVVDESLDV